MYDRGRRIQMSLRRLRTRFGEDAYSLATQRALRAIALTFLEQASGAARSPSRRNRSAGK